MKLQCAPELELDVNDRLLLFENTSDEVDDIYERRNRIGTNIVSLCDVSSPEQSSILSLSFGKKLTAYNLKCTTISLNQTFPCILKDKSETIPCYSHLTLDWQKFDELTQKKPAIHPDKKGAFDAVMMAVDFSAVHHYPKFFPLLDSLIIVVEASEESLREAYKLIKGTFKLNPAVHYFLIFKRVDHDRCSFLFERFSDILSRHLKVNIFWLGYVIEDKDSTDPFDFIQIDIESFISQTQLRSESPAKLTLTWMALQGLKND